MVTVLLILAWVVGVSQVVLDEYSDRVVMRVGEGYEVRTYLRGFDGDYLYSFDRAYGNDVELVGLINGGMFMEDYSPLGLYIEGGRVIRGINRGSGSTNFYLEPNGLFGVYSDGRYVVMCTGDYTGLEGFAYATQSGPMLVIDGEVNSRFIPGSLWIHRRVGIGVDTTGDVVMIMSLRCVNFDDFARMFLEEGCENALHLDGGICGLRYWEQDFWYRDGFGPMIGIRKEGGDDE